MSAFSLPIPPGPLAEPLRRLTERSATTRVSQKLSRIRSFGAWLEPRYIFGAGQLVSTSELLRFL